MTTTPLRVLLVCRAFPSHRPGGMEQHVHELAEGLSQAGHEVHLLTTPLPPSGPLVPLSSHKTVTHIGGRPGRYDLKFFREANRAVVRLHRKHGIDIVHTQGLALFPFAMSSKATVPAIGTIHGTHWNETPLDRRHPDRRHPMRLLANLWLYKHRFATWPLWRLLLARHPRLIADSDFTCRELERESRRLKAHVVPLGFDVSPFLSLTRAEALETRRRLMPAISHEGPLLFAVGRHERVKGFATILSAINRLGSDASFTLVIGGSGPDTVRLRALAAQSPHAKRIHIPGRIPTESLPQWFASADLFLNADEGQPAFGLVNAEALVSGTPVLASKVGAHPEVVLEGDGALIPAGNHRAWQKALTRALARFPETEGGRANRRERAIARFHRDGMIRRIEECYRDAIRSSSSTMHRE